MIDNYVLGRIYVFECYDHFSLNVDGNVISPEPLVVEFIGRLVAETKLYLVISHFTVYNQNNLKVLDSREVHYILKTSIINSNELVIRDQKKVKR